MMSFFTTMARVVPFKQSKSVLIEDSLSSGMSFRWAYVMGLTLFGIALSAEAVNAQVQRHPKINESREAIATQLPDALPDILRRAVYRVDLRSEDDLDAIQDFVSQWDIVSPNTALFLGTWSSASSNGSTSTWSIYPSYKAGGRVCVLRQRKQPNSDQIDYMFGVGHLVTPSAELINDSTDLIYQLNVTGAGFSTAFQRVTPEDIDEFVNDSTFDWQTGTVLAEVTVNPVEDELLVGALSAFPNPLAEPDFGPARSDRTTMVSTYVAAGCTTELPSTREWGVSELGLSATQSLVETPGASFQFDGAYVPVSNTGNSVEVYWTINNQSDRSLAIQPLNIRVETADAMPIDCPAAMDRFRELVSNDEAAGCARGYLDPFQDGFLEPGDSVSGRVVVLREPEDLNDLFLVIPDSLVGGLEAFRVPIQ